MFIIKSTKTDAILCKDNEVRASMLVGAGGYVPKVFKTKGGAERAAEPYGNWRKVVELDKLGCEIR